MNSEPSTAPQTTARRRGWLKLVALVLAAVCAAAVASASVVFVDEAEYVIVERFGEIVTVYDRPQDRGLHWKAPWPVDTVRRFDRRVQLFDPPGREVFSRDKKNMTVSAYVCWKIAEPDSEASSDLASRPVVRFFRNLGGRDVAEERLDGRVRSLLNTEIGAIELSRLLNVADSNAGPSENRDSELVAIAERVRRRLTQSENGEPPLTKKLGIEIVDLRIRRINFPTGNRQAVYDRMRSERKKEADEYRTAGMAENRAMRSRADLEYERILAKARADAERIRGTADATAIALRNSAHAKDPEFYVAMRTLEAYRKILNEKTTLVLSASSNLLKMLTDGIPEPKAGSEGGRVPAKAAAIPKNAGPQPDDDVEGGGP